MAAVGATSSLINLLVNFFIGISVGANVLVARFCGGGEYRDAKESVQTALLIGLAGGLILIVLGIVASRPMLTLMATPEEVIDQATLYMRLYFVGMPATMIYNFGAAILRAVGDTRRPLYFLLFAGVFNVGCDVLFIVAFDWGVAGAAAATVIAQLISATLIVMCLTRMDGVCHLNLENVHFYRDKFFRIMQVGLYLPTAKCDFQYLECTDSVVDQLVRRDRGCRQHGGEQYRGLCLHLNELALSDLAELYQSEPGRQERQAHRPCILYCMGLVIVIGLVLGNGAHLLGEHLLGIYSSDPEVIQFGMMRLSVVSVTYFLCGMMDVVAGSVRGLGYSILPMLVSFVGACLFRIISIFTIFQWQHTLFNLYISYPISWTLTVCAHGVLLHCAPHGVCAHAKG